MVVKIETIYARDNAATAAASSCINGGGGLGLGSVGGDGEELSEEIHWCDCVECGSDRCDETVLKLRGSFMLSFLYVASLSLGRVGSC
jgi:hypothetical protein